MAGPCTAEVCTSICSAVASWNSTPGAETVTSLTPASLALSLEAWGLAAMEPFCTQAG